MVQNLKFEEDKLEWDYNIPKSLSYELIEDDNCYLCKDKALGIWTAKYLTANVPYDKILELIDIHFGDIVTREMLLEHKRHIRISFMLDTEIRNKAIDDIKKIESDLGAKVDEKKALESQIRSMYARKIYMESNGIYDKTYVEINKTLKSLIELKLKMKNELGDHQTKTSLEDIIKINVNVNQQQAVVENKEESHESITVEQERRRKKKLTN